MVTRPQTAPPGPCREAVDTSEARLASARDVERPGQVVTARRLGSGTRRAVRLASAVGPVQYAKLDQALRRFVDGDPAAPVRVIVQTQPGQHEATARWLTTAGRQVHRVHPVVVGLTATLSAADVAALSGDPSIRRLSIDAVARATSELTPRFTGFPVPDVSRTDRRGADGGN